MRVTDIMTPAAACRVMRSATTGYLAGVSAMVEGGFRHLPFVDASGARAAAAAAATAAAGGGGGSGGGWLSALGGLIAPLWGAGAGAAEDDEDAALADAADAAALDGMLPGERANGELRPVAGVLDISHVLTALAFVHEAEQQKREDAAARGAVAGAAGRSGAGGAGKGILSPGAPAAVSGVGKTPRTAARARGRGDTADDEDDEEGSYCDDEEGGSLSSRVGGGRGAGRDAEEMAAAGTAAAAGGRLPPRVSGVAGAAAAAAARVDAGALRRGSCASLASLAASAAAAGGGAGGFDAASTHSDGASARGRALSVADSFAGTAVTAETAPTRAASEEGGAGSGAHGYGHAEAAAAPAPPAAHRLIFDASDPADGRIVGLLSSAARAHRRYGDRVKSSSAKIASVAAAETASLMEGGLPAVGGATCGVAQ